MIELPPYKPKAKCPKCHYDSVGTKYWASGHQDCPAFGDAYAGYRIVSGAFPATPSTTERARDLVAQMREHLDRTCHRCGHSWTEATI